MKLKLLVPFLLFLHLFYSQQNVEQNTYAQDITPIKSLKFNRYLINPVFSFARETSSNVNFFNRRQWSGFENSPITYLVNYNARVAEKAAVALGINQSTIGLFSSFGANANLALKTDLGYETALYYGLNLSYFSSRLDAGTVVTPVPDPSVLNYPTTNILSLRPGISYRFKNFDLGLSANNILALNFGSGAVKNDATNALQGHAMYTYKFEYGSLEQSVLTGLALVEKRKNDLIYSGTVLLDSPNFGWAQLGYNSAYGASIGLGATIYTKLSIGYTIEKGFGAIGSLGLNHEISLAYNFAYYEEDEGVYIPRVTVKKKTPEQIAAEEAAKAENLRLKEEQDSIRLAKLEEKRIADEEKKRLDEENRLKALAEKDSLDKIRKEQEEQERLRKLEADSIAKIQEEEKRLARAKLDSIKKIQEAEEAKRRKAEQDSLEKVRLAQDSIRKVKEATEAKRRQAEQDSINKVKAAAEAKRLQAEQDSIKKAQDAEKARLDSIKKAEADAAARKLKEEQDSIKKAQDAEKARLDSIKKAEDAEKARLDSIKKAEAAAEAKRLQAEQDSIKKAQDAEKARLDSIKKAEADAAARKLKEEQDSIKRAEADKIEKARLDSIKKAEAAAEQARLLKAEQDSIKKAEADRIEKARLDSIKKAEAEAEAKRIADSIKKAEEERKQREIDKANSDIAKTLVPLKNIENELKANLEKVKQAIDEEEAKKVENFDPIQIQDKITEAKAKVKEIQDLNATSLKVLENQGQLNSEEAKKLKAETSQLTQSLINLEKSIADLKVEIRNERLKKIKLADLDNVAKQTANNKNEVISRISKGPDAPIDADVLNKALAGQQEVPINETQNFKGLQTTDKGYYAVIYTATSPQERDVLLTKALKDGVSKEKLSAFYHNKENKYYIYIDKVNDSSKLEDLRAMKSKTEYTKFLFIVKVE